MLLKLHNERVTGVSIISQIIDYFQGLIIEDQWPGLIRTAEQIITELDIVVSDTEFEGILNRHHAYLYVGRHQDLPAAYASFYRNQPFHDWIILLKRKDDLYADPTFLFSFRPATQTTLH